MCPVIYACANYSKCVVVKLKIQAELMYMMNNRVDLNMT